jgi:hypothetical protein
MDGKLFSNFVLGGKQKEGGKRQKAKRAVNE